MPALGHLQTLKVYNYDIRERRASFDLVSNVALVDASFENELLVPDLSINRPCCSGPTDGFSLAFPGPTNSRRPQRIRHRHRQG